MGQTRQKAPHEQGLLTAFSKDQRGPIQLRAERLPTACAAGVQDFAASFGGHACAKAVTAFANQVRWLERAFHRSLSGIVAQLGALVWGPLDSGESPPG